MSGGRLAPAVAQQSFERPACAGLRVRVAEQPLGEDASEVYPVQIKGELRGVEVGTKVPGVGGNARGVRESVEPLPLRCREKIPGGAGAIVEIEGCGGDEAATRHGGIGSPAEPAVEVGTDPRLAPFGPGGGTDHGIAEPLGGAAQHLELERVLGADVGKEPALGEPELGGEAADGESVEPIAAGDAFGVGEDAVAGGG